MERTRGNKETERPSPNYRRSKAHVADAASDLMNEGKKLMSELYEEGLDRVSDAQDTVMVYSDELLKKIKERPLTSILIAGGVGFLLSSFLKK